MTTALIMAGGRGERMRATGQSTPKPLVAVRGVPLLERNLMNLLCSDFRDIAVAVPSHTPEIGLFVRTRGLALANCFDAKLRLLEETSPLGNIGAVAELETPQENILVIYADNLTCLDLNALVGHHERIGAALTSAVHLEPFRIPFGEVQVQDGMIVSYVEKSERRIMVASGLFVLSSSAIRRIPREQRIEVSCLANRLLAEGARVGAFFHDSPWIDVNDVTAVERAEQVVADHADAFECRAATPDDTVVSAVVRQSDKVILERRQPTSSRYPGTWDLPGDVLKAGHTAEAMIERELRGALGLDVITLGTPFRFDDLDPATRQMHRHIVFPVEGGGGRLSSPPGRTLRLMPERDLDLWAVSPTAARALAATNVSNSRRYRHPTEGLERTLTHV